MTNQKLTKEQILEHVSGINLFLTRGNAIVKVLMVDGNQSYNYFTVARLTGPEEDRNYEGIYALNDDGRYFTSGNESDNDIVALVTAKDLEKFIKANDTTAIDLMQCMRDRAFLKTRCGEKAIVLAHVPEDDYVFKGVLIDGERFLESASWTEDGKYSDKDIEHDCDIVGLWEE